MFIDSLYDYGDIVFLKTDPDQLERIVCKLICQPGNICYGLSMGSTFSEHYDFEISAQKNLMKELNISNGTI